MWSTSPQRTATPSRRRTRVRRVTPTLPSPMTHCNQGAMGTPGEGKGGWRILAEESLSRTELPCQHGPEDVRADRGQGEEPSHMPDEGARQDEHRNVPAGEAVEERLDRAPPCGTKFL